MYSGDQRLKSHAFRHSRAHRFRNCQAVHESIANGTDRLAVGPVLFAGDNGNNPTNTKRRLRKSVPVFSDLHLSYSWETARRMCDGSRELKFPRMAGSSISATVRTPELKNPHGAWVEHAVAAGNGDIDVCGFQIPETLQGMVERRAGGESGIAAVNGVNGTRTGQHAARFQIR